MIKLLSFLATAAILIFATHKQDDKKEYAAKLTVLEWQIIISNQDDVAKNQRDKVIAKIAKQIQPQIEADTLQKQK